LNRLQPAPHLAARSWLARALGLPKVLILASLALSAPLQAADKPVTTAPAAPAALASSTASAASGAAARPPEAAASAPPVSVSLVRAQPRDFTISIEANGSVVPLSNVEVKPQVSAQVLQVHVKEGQLVKRGQLLFTLDARADQANLLKAQAQLQKDEATLADARRLLARNQELLGKNFISQGALDSAQTNVEALQAAIAADRAAVEAVRVQLSFSRISAAGAGRVGPINVFAGSSVSPTGPALLSITQFDPIAVAFSLPQRNLPDALAALAVQGGAPVKVVRTSSPGQPDVSRQGRLVFVDSNVDATSGTVKVKAQIDNKDQAFWPGAYVNVSMALQTLPDAISIPQAAIVQGARGSFVFVAGPGNKAAIRPVKLLASAGVDAVVSGLQPGDRVVLDGRQNLRPGTPLIIPQSDASSGGGGGGGAGSGRRGGGAASGPEGASAPQRSGGAASGAGGPPAAAATFAGSGAGRAS
jgi:RND family efflux transporter MFP subunit